MEVNVMKKYNIAVVGATGMVGRTFLKVLEEISAEENVHVGQLQEVLKRISPNATEIDKGTKEAKSQLGLVNGLLPVQSWDDAKKSDKLTSLYKISLPYLPVSIFFNSELENSILSGNDDVAFLKVPIILETLVPPKLAQ